MRSRPLLGRAACGVAPRRCTARTAPGLFLAVGQLAGQAGAFQHALRRVISRALRAASRARAASTILAHSALASLGCSSSQVSSVRATAFAGRTSLETSLSLVWLLNCSAPSPTARRPGLRACRRRTSDLGLLGQLVVGDVLVDDAAELARHLSPTARAPGLRACRRIADLGLLASSLSVMYLLMMGRARAGRSGASRRRAGDVVGEAQHAAVAAFHCIATSTPTAHAAGRGLGGDREHVRAARSCCG